MVPRRCGHSRKRFCNGLKFPEGTPSMIRVDGTGGRPQSTGMTTATTTIRGPTGRQFRWRARPRAWRSDDATHRVRRLVGAAPEPGGQPEKFRRTLGRAARRAVAERRFEDPCRRIANPRRRVVAPRRWLADSRGRGRAPGRWGRVARRRVDAARGWIADARRRVTILAEGRSFWQMARCC